jgi:HEAT repeat protein
LQVAFWAGIGSVATSLALLGAIMLLRMRLIARQAHERSFADLWQPLLVACVDEVPQRLPDLAQSDADRFLRLWNRMHGSLRGPAQDRLKELARRAGAARIAASFLASRSLARRLLGILTAGNLREASACGALESALDDERVVVSLSAAHALIRIDPGAALPRVLSIAGARPDWAISRVIAILNEAGPEHVSAPLARALVSALARPGAAAEVARLLRFAPAARPGAVRAPVRYLLQRSADPEATAAALAALEDPADADHARRQLTHPAHFVRVQAVKALARIGSAADRALLVGALGDRSWWVRYRAAKALIASPWTTPADLARIEAALPDRFALDILRQSEAEPR